MKNKMQKVKDKIFKFMIKKSIKTSKKKIQLSFKIIRI